PTRDIRDGRRIRAGPRQGSWRGAAHRPADPQHVPDARSKRMGLAPRPSRAADRNRRYAAWSWVRSRRRRGGPLAREGPLHSRARRGRHEAAVRPDPGIGSRAWAALQMALAVREPPSDRRESGAAARVRTSTGTVAGGGDARAPSRSAGLWIKPSAAAGGKRGLVPEG